MRRDWGQSPIVAIYTSAGVKMASYTYDAWGNVTITYHNGASSSSINNPFTYRGYYFDKDLGLYYLNSRYYDSNTGRFINVDSIMCYSEYSIQGYNLYAYCFNNPISFVDTTGSWPGFKNFFSTIGKYIVKAITAVVDSIELEVGVGVGVGVNANDNITLDVSRDTYVGIDDGDVVTGNIIAVEASLLDVVSVGETFNHLTEKNGNRVSLAGPTDGPFDMIKYPDVQTGNQWSFLLLAKNNEGELLLSLSASAHFILGGRASISFNFSECFRRIFE